MPNSRGNQKLLEKVKELTELRDHWMRTAQDHKDEVVALQNRVRELEAMVASMQGAGASE